MRIRPHCEPEPRRVSAWRAGVVHVGPSPALEAVPFDADALPASAAGQGPLVPVVIASDAISVAASFSPATFRPDAT